MAPLFLGNSIDKAIKDLDEIVSKTHKGIHDIYNPPVKSNVALVKWWHFRWFLSIQIKLFGKVIVY